MTCFLFSKSPFKVEEHFLRLVLKWVLQSKFMIKAGYNDRLLVVDILTKCFDDNKSVNYIIRPGEKRRQRIISLMEYSFDVCYRSGKVYISEDRKACALITFPDKRKTTFKSVLSDIKFILLCLGISNLTKAMRREAAIKKIQPKELIYYLWFIGVEPAKQGKGIGSHLMQEIIADARAMNRTICLETSTLKNIPWYEKFGFKIYKELDFGYRLYCLKRDLPK